MVLLEIVKVLRVLQAASNTFYLAAAVISKINSVLMSVDEVLKLAGILRIFEENFRVVLEEMIAKFLVWLL